MVTWITSDSPVSYPDAVAEMEARVAELLDVSPRTVRREWTLARAWLRAEMEARS